MTWKSINRSEASRLYGELSLKGFVPESPRHPFDRQLRSELLEKIPPFTKGMSEIFYDLNAGFALSEVLRRHGMPLSSAADDGFWRHLSLSVIPEIIHARWGGSKNPEARFHNQKRRVWLRALWWFLYLTWQGSEEATRSALTRMTTDDVVQLVERPGRGFRLDLCREIVRQASSGLPDTRLRAILKLNTAYLVSREPTFQERGTLGYVEDLLEPFKVLQSAR